ncbi:MAG: sensor domain-containing diguanylate cyclase [Desulfuromonas sp.]|nr:MAG: sensor domain-containing diguanylate cyclase [Desulfuromonas sp.]
MKDMHFDEVGENRLEQELKALVDVGKALTSRLSLEEVFQTTMDKVSSLLNPSAWSLLILDQDSRELCFEIAVSPVADKLKGIRLPPGQGIAGFVAESGEPLLVADVRQDERFCGKIDESVGFVTSSIICVPLKTHDKTLGVIQLLNALGQDQFEPRDLRVLSAIADFTAIAIENARLVERVQELTITDDLTGLYNSRHFQTIIDYEVERAGRQGTEVSLVFLDLDHFKQVNDTYGHLTGSRLLSEIGQTIGKNTRKVDYAARYGGDEFVILLPGTGNEGALGMIRNLRERFRQGDYRSDCDQKIEVTASIGVATYPTNAPDKSELIRLADMAMYAVKKSTRNAVLTAFDLPAPETPDRAGNPSS